MNYYSEKDFDFASHGAFFCFSQKQFDEQKKDWIEYTSIGSGLVLPKSKAKEIIEAMDNHYESEHKKRIEVMWIDNIILHEYNNHECDWSNDIEPLEFLIKDYGTSWNYIEWLLKSKGKYFYPRG